MIRRAFWYCIRRLAMWRDVPAAIIHNVVFEIDDDDGITAFTFTVTPRRWATTEDVVVVRTRFVLHVCKVYRLKHGPLMLLTKDRHED